jgi:hypothetical protein
MLAKILGAAARIGRAWIRKRAVASAQDKCSYFADMPKEQVESTLFGDNIVYGRNFY